MVDVVTQSERERNMGAPVVRQRLRTQRVSNGHEGKIQKVSSLNQLSLTVGIPIIGESVLYSLSLTRPTAILQGPSRLAGIFDHIDARSIIN